MREISENIDDCQNSQKRFSELLDDILKNYENIFVTAENATWWQGNTKDQFLAEMEAQKEKMIAVKKDLEKEKEFYHSWDKHIKEIDGFFRQISESIKRIMGDMMFGHSRTYEENWNNQNNGSLESYRSAIKDFYHSMGLCSDRMTAAKDACVKITATVIEKTKKIKEEKEESERKFNLWKQDFDSFLNQKRAEMDEIENRDKGKFDLTPEEQELLAGYNPNNSYRYDMSKLSKEEKELISQYEQSNTARGEQTNE